MTAPWRYRLATVAFLLLLVVGQLGAGMWSVVSLQSVSLWFAFCQLLLLLAVGRAWMPSLNHPLGWLLLAALVWAALGLLVNTEAYESVQWLRLAELVILIGFAGAVAVAWRNDMIRFEGLMALLLWGGVLVVLQIVRLWLSHDAPRDVYWSWSVTPFLNIRHLAYALVPAWCGGLWFLANGSTSRWLRFALFLFMLLAFWAGGRALILAMAMPVAVMIWLPQWRPKTGTLLRLFAPAFFFAALFQVSDPALGVRSLFTRSLGAISGEAYSSGRLQMWQDVWSHFLHHPLFGFGPGGYQYMPWNPTNAVQPHNGVLQLLGEFGLAGVLVLVALAWASLRVIRVALQSQRDRLDTRFVFILATCAAYLVLVLVDGALFHALPMTVSVVLAVTAWHFAGDRVKDFVLLRHLALPAAPAWLPVMTAGLAGGLLLKALLVWADRPEPVPAPESFRATLVKAVPASTYSAGFWLAEWRLTDPGEARDWLDWLPAVHSGAETLYLDAAEAAFDAGQPELGEYWLDKALTHSRHNPPWLLVRIDQIRGEYEKEVAAENSAIELSLPFSQ